MIGPDRAVIHDRVISDQFLGNFVPPITAIGSDRCDQCLAIEFLKEFIVIGVISDQLITFYFNKRDRGWW